MCRTVAVMIYGRVEIVDTEAENKGLAGEIYG